MSTELFDEIARTLARDGSRRQAVTGLLGGAVGSLAALFGVKLKDHGFAGGRPLPLGASSAAAAYTFKVYVPLAMTPNPCKVASTCEKKAFCSADQTCRCIMSAEGEIRCGVIPSCDVKHCKTSSDCAEFGAGYFCDTPNSGCCSDAEQQRCIAPCGTVNPYCTVDRICGDVCCPVGQLCVNGQCVGEAFGTWEGTTTSQGETIGVRFILQDAKGTLTGQMFIKDPKTSNLIDLGPLTGTRGNDTANWTTTLGSIGVSGTFSKETFTGTVTLPGRNTDAQIKGAVTLTRTVTPALPAAAASSVTGSY